MDIWLKDFIAFVVIQNVQTQLRLVVNTTCLELAQPSNQQFRLTCRQYDYHCLLDESYTREFEVCREWKWIPGGKCAYFNTYGSGNVDERKCEPGINLTCSEHKHQFESKTNIQFTACYAKRHSSTSFTTSASPVQVTSNNMTSDGDSAKSSPTSKAWIFILLTGIAVLLLISVMFFINGYMDKPLCKIERSVETGEQQSFLGNKKKDIEIPEYQQTVRHENEKKTTTKKGNTPKRQVGDTSKSSERTASSSLTPVNLDSVTKNEDESADFKDALDYFQTEDISEGEIFENKKTAKTASGSGFDSVTSDNDNEESTGVFNDTFESLQMEAPQTDAIGHEKLYDLLNGGMTLKVMAAVIKKMTGKTVGELLDNENVQEKVENFLNDGTNHLARKKEGEESIHVSYALLRIFLDEKHHPKSGWSNPVKDKDIGIGDDIDRLFRIFTITKEISNPNELCVESYNRLLDIMVETFTRLDTDAQFKEDIQAFVLKYRSPPSWTKICLIS